MVAETIHISEDMTENDKEFLSELSKVIYAEIEKGVTDIDSIAAKMHTNTGTLRRRLAQTVGITPKAYLLQMRMSKAKHLLQNYRDMTIAEVADKCGYSQLPNFTRAFKNYYGVMPSEVRSTRNEEMKE